MTRDQTYSIDCLAEEWHEWIYHWAYITTITCLPIRTNPWQEWIIRTITTMARASESGWIGAKIGCFRTVCFSVIYYHHDLKKSSTIKQPRVRWRKKNKSGASISIHPARNNFLFPLHPGTRVTKEEEFRATIMQKQRRAMGSLSDDELHMTSPWRCGDIHTIRHLVCSIWRLVAFCAVADGEGTVGTSSSSIWKCKGLLIQDIMWMATWGWTHQDHQFWQVADNLFLMHFRWTKRRGLIHATTKSLNGGFCRATRLKV